MLSNKLVISEKAVVHGRGLIASEPVGRGEILWQSDRDYPQVDLPGLINLRESGNREYYSQIDDNLYARNSSAAWRFNHSCVPNCKLHNRQTVAMRDIARGEELTYDYGLTEIGRPFRFWCDCHSLHCRTLVTNLDYLHVATLDRGIDAASDYAQSLAAGASWLDHWRVAVLRSVLVAKHQYLPGMAVPLVLRQWIYRLGFPGRKSP